MIYSFRGPGAPRGIPAEVVGAELQRIYVENGGIKPAEVVNQSRPPTAPLHTAFEWDDSVAAESYRESQARMIVRSVVLVAEPEKNELAPLLRAFVSLHDPATKQGRLYKPMIEVLGSPDESEEVKRRLRNELLALRRRYMDLLDAADLVTAMKEVLLTPA